MGPLLSLTSIAYWISAATVAASPLPASHDASSLSLGDFQEDPASTVPFVPFTNASSLTAWLDISQPVNGQTIIYYTVPGTSTRLVMNVWETEIPSQAMSSVILRTMNYAATHLSTKGDGALESQEDPFWIDSRQGVIFGIWSTYTGKHLTYNDLKDTARGLWSALYMEKKYCAASVEVYNRDYMHGRTRLGYGVIRGGRLRSSLSDS